MDYLGDSIIYISLGIFVVVLFIIIFTVISIFSPKLRGKMLSRQVKAVKYMYDEVEDDLMDLSVSARDNLKTFKKTFNDDKTYCKHCGAPIDDDSIYCKKCGKKQI